MADTNQRNYDNILPKGSYDLTSGYKWRTQVTNFAGEVQSKAGFHYGVDLGAPQGTPARVPRGGVLVDRNDSYINADGSVDPRGLYAIFAVPNAEKPVAYIHFYHLSNNKYFEKGKPVSAGSIIGEVGSTGASTAPHLHLGEYRAIYNSDGTLKGGSDYGMSSAIPEDPGKDVFGFSKPAGFLDQYYYPAMGWLYDHTIGTAIQQQAAGLRWVSNKLGITEDNATYTVQSGDLLSTIAPRYVDANGRPLTWQDIARVNPDIDPNRIAPGQNLKLPPNVRLADGSSPGAATTASPEVEVDRSHTRGPIGPAEAAQSPETTPVPNGVHAADVATTDMPEGQASFGVVANRLGNLILDTVLPKAHGADQPPAPYAEDTAPVSSDPAANAAATTSISFTPLPSYAGDHPTLTIQPGDTIGAIAQSLAMTPGEYGAYLRTVYGPNANLNDLLPGRTLPVPPEVVERLPQFNTLTEVPSGDAQPNSPELANAADTLLPSPEGFGSPAYSFNKPVNDEALSQQRWAEGNSYAQGFQSALSFIQALEQGNELSAAVAGVSMLNAFARASGITDPSKLPFLPTTTAGLGAASAAMNLYDALKADDGLGALAAATNLGSQVATLYAANASQAAAQTAGGWAQGLGTAAGVLGIANSLKHGDEVGATASALMLASQLSWIGPWGTAVGLAIGIARALFGGDDPPEPRGTAEVRWGADGSLSVAVTEDDDGGGKSAQGMMQSMVDTLNGYLGQQTDAHGDPSFALIPQRLPTVSFFQREYAEFMLNYTDEHGQRITRHYNGQGQRMGLDGSALFIRSVIREVA